jgi:hypothetical protein
VNGSGLPAGGSDFPAGGRRTTLHPMSYGRLLRLLLLLLAPVTLGWAEGMANVPVADTQPAAETSIVSSRQSLPAPVHDEATCGFCQAAVFPPCTPVTVSVPADPPGIVREEPPSPDARVPHSTARRLASSRAPPTLRID